MATQPDLFMFSTCLEVDDELRLWNLDRMTHFFLVGLGSSTLQLQDHDPTVIPNTNPDGRDGRVVSSSR